jgi:hypothetical protein
MRNRNGNKQLTKFLSSLVALHVAFCLSANDASVYALRPDDPEAFYFTPENYAVKADGKTDVSDELQAAIDGLKTEKAFGILFIPEGKYLISKTIRIPSAIRLIGYGKNRPEIILGRNTPGYRQEQNYMIWFTGGLPQAGRPVQDAGAGTFYSALSNINLRIEKGNPQATGIRSHFAQHSFISHCCIYAGDGKAGVCDVGNEMENVCFYGGDYGITSGRTSPGWPMMMVDTYFEGQRKAAILSREAGFAIVNMYVKNVPVAFEMEQNCADRLHIENSYLENVSEAGIVVGVENNSFSQLNLIDIHCKNVPVLVHYVQSGKKEEVKAAVYLVKDYTCGIVLSSLSAPSQNATICSIEPLARFTPPVARKIPQLPAMDTWVNIRNLGAKGDGETDEFAAGITTDSRGNAYFGENRLKKIYKWDASAQALSLLADYPWKPFTMAVDTEDNLLVIFRYDPQPGYLVNGEQESVPRLPDDNPMYSGWGNSGWAAWGYSVNPEDPDETFAPLQRIAAKDAANVRRIIHPASRWRGDFGRVATAVPEYSFLAPDGVTIIPETYDLSRSAALIPVTPGQPYPLYVAHENNKTTVRLDVNADGSLSNLTEAFPRGQYGSATDKDGNVYVADGEIFVYDKSGREIKRIQLEERPISIAVGGRDFKTLFATTSRSLYGIQL